MRRRIFLLSPAHCGGERARLVFNPDARFDLAQRLRAAPGAPLGEVFSFLSGLYFRGKLAYAQAFARPPAGRPGVLVITPTDGLVLAEEPVDFERLRRFAEVDIAVANARYMEPLLRDARRLAEALDARCDVVLLGSIASPNTLRSPPEISRRPCIRATNLLRFAVFTGSPRCRSAGIPLKRS